MAKRSLKSIRENIAQARSVVLTARENLEKYRANAIRRLKAGERSDDYVSDALNYIGVFDEEQIAPYRTLDGKLRNAKDEEVLVVLSTTQDNEDRVVAFNNFIIGKRTPAKQVRRAERNKVSYRLSYGIISDVPEFLIPEGKLRIPTNGRHSSLTVNGNYILNITFGKGVRFSSKDIVTSLLSLMPVEDKLPVYIGKEVSDYLYKNFGTDLLEAFRSSKPGKLRKRAPLSLRNIPYDGKLPSHAEPDPKIEL